MSNITDATCAWGLAQTESGCTRTLASYAPERYLTFQIVYCAVGTVSALACVIMYIRSVKYEGSRLQQAIFLFCCYASMTVVIRGGDPRSYGHIIPRPIGSYLSDSCTSALYSVYILALGYWATVIQRGAGITEKPVHLKCLEGTAIAVVWAFYIVYDMLLFLWKGFSPKGMSYVQMTVSAVMLAIISTTFLIYGLRVFARLQEYERMRKAHMPTLSERMLNRRSLDMALSDDDDGLPMIPEPSYSHRRPRDGHSSKIIKILVVAETVSLVVIAGQMYVAVSSTASTPVELSCANGKLCETVELGVSLLHIFQVLCVWVLLWTFGKINKKEVVPQPRN